MNKAVHPLVQLAHQAIEAYVREGRRLSPPAEGALTPEMREHAGAFVSLHEAGELRGCIGTFLPQQNNVAEEVIENAIASATRDPRFEPVRNSELGQLDISVDVLGEPEEVPSMANLDPEVYGVIVVARRDNRRGLLLPALEQVKTAEQQVAIARQKAWIGPDEPVRLYRFQVKRYH
ncbi:MAG: AmmeMemoRadiSam system protein A [Anaerolineae bacterium]